MSTQPVTIPDGKILDGRHRQRAATLSGNPYHKGDRVRLNEHGAGQFPQFKNLSGVVAHEPKQGDSVGIRFPGRSATQYFALVFIERVEQQATPAASPTGAE